MAQAPKIEMVPMTDQRLPYPLSWDEQRLLFAELPDRLARMALLAVNTGCRDGEICGLRWEWEQQVEELETSVFVIPRPKNRIPRVVVLNRIAREIVDGLRGQHPEFVFSYRGHRIETMNNTAWQSARRRAAEKYVEHFKRACPEGFRTLHVHNLRHTVGRRLRALKVPFETRQDVLGHKNGNITTHYSAAEVSELLDAVKVLEQAATDSRPLTMLRVVA
jgi:integrase